MGYLPTEEGALVVWFNDHAAGVAIHGANVGFSAGEITQAATDAALVSHAVNGRSLYMSKAQEFTAYKDILLYAPINTPMPGTPSAPVLSALPLGALTACVPRARARAERMKAHPNYTQAMGEDCRIVSPAEPPPPSQPTLQAQVLTGFQVRLLFAMLGHAQIEIVSRRAGETEWTLLTFDTNSPYLDARPPLVAGQPEIREYQARFRDNDVPVGDWSDIVSATAQP
jgi:hypothetical protein